MDYALTNNVPWNATILIPGTVDLTLGTMHMQLRATAATDSVIMDLSTTNGLITLYAAGREAVIHVSTLAMEQVAPLSYVYDAVFTPVVGDAFIVQSGQVVVTQGVTR